MKTKEVFRFLFQPIGDVTSSIMFYYSIVLDIKFVVCKADMKLVCSHHIDILHGATSASGATQPIKSTLQTPTLCNEAPGEACGHGAPSSCHTNIYNSPPSAASSHLTNNPRVLH